MKRGTTTILSSLPRQYFLSSLLSRSYNNNTTSVTLTTTKKHLLWKGCHRSTNGVALGKIGCPMLFQQQQQQQQQQQYYSSSSSNSSSNTHSAIYTPLPSSMAKKRTAKENRRKGKGRQSYRFVDRTKVQASGGSGGKGSTAMYHIGRKRKRRPDGGHGGNGGSVLILADPNQQSLKWTKPHIKGHDGSSGGSKNKHGKNGSNTILRVPCGVVVRKVLEHDELYDPRTKTITKLPDAVMATDDPTTESNHGLFQKNKNENKNDHVPEESFKALQRQFRQAGGYWASLDYDSDEDNNDDDDCYESDDLYDTNDENDASAAANIASYTAWGERETVEIADLDTPGSHVVVANGGRGGYGNISFATTNGPLPPAEVIAKFAEAQLGETCRLELELKLIADIGLVGFPNAGKSSLLSATSKATPYIAPYPFTTLHPLVGYIEYKDGFRVCAADVPGLIEGASEGKGKGHDFLRHLERTRALLYIVDAAGMDGRDPVEDFEVLIAELSAYGDGDMLNRKCLVVANKVDLLLEDEKKEICFKLRTKAEEAGIKMETDDVIGISAGATGEGLAFLTKAVRKTVLSAS